MRFANELNPTEAELRTWAAEAGADEPSQDWDMILSWGMERGRLRVIIDLAADTSLPNHWFFLLTLYSWVEHVAGCPNYSIMRPAYAEWLDVARGVRDPAVKRWRHAAREIFQGRVPFDRGAWQAKWNAEYARYAPTNGNDG